MTRAATFRALVARDATRERLRGANGLSLASPSAKQGKTWIRDDPNASPGWSVATFALAIEAKLGSA